jgi:hypothetical protein
MRDAPPSVRTATRNDLEAIERLDAQSFGVSRKRLLASLAEDSQKVLVCDKDGQLEAYGVIRQGARAAYLGPMTATSAEEGRNIAAALLAHFDRSRQVFWDIPDPNPAAVRHASDFGFTVQRKLTRMYLGRNVPCRVERLFGIAGPEVG